jgi:hypothetical protein
VIVRGMLGRVTFELVLLSSQYSAGLSLEF